MTNTDTTEDKIYSVTDIQALKPCDAYQRDGWRKLRELVGDGVTKHQIAAAPVTWQDRIWVLVRLMPAACIPLYAADVAESVLHLTREQDRAVCREAIDAARSGDRARARRAGDAAAAAAAAAAADATAYATATAYAAFAAAAATDYAAAAATAYAAYDAYADAYDAARRTKGEEPVKLALRYVA